MKLFDVKSAVMATLFAVIAYLHYLFGGAGHDGSAIPLIGIVGALTNFGALQTNQKLVWSRDTWKQARENSFIMQKFVGTGENNVIQKITELTKTEKGDKCIITLVAELVGDGGTGDNKREGNEEAMKQYDEEITIDLIFHSVRNEGKLAEQKSVVRFRDHAKEKLGNWLADRVDQLAFLTLSGIAYSYNCDGSTRVNSNFPNLAFAADVTAPTANRHRRWVASTGLLAAGDTASVVVGDIMSYKAITAMMAYAKDHYIKPLKAGGKEYYILLMKPGSLMQLKNDADYKNAVIQGLPRDLKNPFFTGATVTVDGAIIHEHRYVYSTNGAAGGSKWGAAGAINGTRVLLLGQQAMGLADLGAPDWVEKGFEYDSQQGINVDKMFGLKKPQFYSNYDKTVEDFGVLAVDFALPQY